MPIIKSFTSFDEALFEKVCMLESVELDQSWTFLNWKNQFSSTRELVIYCSFEEDELIAFALFELLTHEDMLHLYKIAVKGPYKRHGYGRQLIRSAMRESGASKLYLEVAVNNNAALALYKKIGLEIQTLKKNFYSNGHDALILCGVPVF